MIKSFEINNFKAIAKAKVDLTPLTAFIGYNGVGKSSLLEALEFFKSLITDDIDTAIRPWREFEHIYYKGKKKKNEFFKNGLKYEIAPMQFSFNTVIDKSNIKFSSSIFKDKHNNDLLFFLNETINHPSFNRSRDADNNYITKERKTNWKTPEKSIIIDEPDLRRYIEKWQFLSMNTFLLGNPYPQKKTGGNAILNRDGSNFAEFILSIRDKNIDAYNGILETIQSILPYATNLQPIITTEVEKMVYMQMTEQGFQIPGWVLSTGTLKILALLSVFRNPEPAPLIVIEEIENGLDPRSIHLIINEIQNFVENTGSQVILTTHSPYFLDLLKLSQIYFVHRKDGNVCFNRPSKIEELKKWTKEYTPGEMYRKDMFNQYIS